MQPNNTQFLAIVGLVSFAIGLFTLGYYLFDPPVEITSRRGTPHKLGPIERRVYIVFGIGLIMTAFIVWGFAWYR